MSPFSHLKWGIVFTSQGCHKDQYMHLNNFTLYLNPGSAQKRIALITVLQVQIVFFMYMPFLSNDLLKIISILIIFVFVNYLKCFTMEFSQVSTSCAEAVHHHNEACNP
jgi:hypothetical protein